MANRDLTRILFNSNWDNANGRANLYMIGLPDNAILDPTKEYYNNYYGRSNTTKSVNPALAGAQNAANNLGQAQQNQAATLEQVGGVSVRATKDAAGKLTVNGQEDKLVVIDSANQFKTPREVQQLLDAAAAKGARAVLLRLSGPDNYALESELLGQSLATAQRDREGVYRGAAGNNFYSRAQIADLENYARSNGIELIPEVNLPGQAEFISKLLKQKDPARAEQVFNGHTGQAAARFAQDLYGEVANAFSQSQHFHMGGADFDGIISDNANYIDFVNGNARFLTNRGLKPQLWNDGLLPASLTKLNRAVEVGYRLEDGQRASKEALEAAGFTVSDQRGLQQ